MYHRQRSVGLEKYNNRCRLVTFTMEITNIDAYPLSSPIKPPQRREFYGGVRRLNKRDFVLVTVETADGLRGFAPGGASSSAVREYFENSSQNGFADVINGPVAKALESEQFDSLDEAVSAIDALDLPELITSQSVASVDIALHDVLGKRHGAPIYELLDEEQAHTTTTLSLYASAGMYMSPEGYATQAETLADLGFFGYKYRPGISPERDRETVTEIRERVGPEMEIMVDAHTWWKLEERSYTDRQQAEIIEALEAADIYWLEEPVTPDDYEGYKRLADSISIPLAGGESETTPDGLIRLAKTGAISFLQGDVRHHRGYTGCMRVTEHCDNTDVQFVPHQFGTHLGLVANAHLVAASPGAEILEYPVFEGDPYLNANQDPGMYPYPLAFDVLDDQLDISEGIFSVPDGPGLGVEVNMDVLEGYEYIEGAWTEFEYEAP